MYEYEIMNNTKLNETLIPNFKKQIFNKLNIFLKKNCYKELKTLNKSMNFQIKTEKNEKFQIYFKFNHENRRIQLTVNE